MILVYFYSPRIRAWRQYGLTLTQVSALVVIREYPEHKIPLKKLEQELHVSQPTVAGIVNRHEQSNVALRRHGGCGNRDRTQGHADHQSALRRTRSGHSAAPRLLRRLRKHPAVQRYRIVRLSFTHPKSQDRSSYESCRQ